MEQPGCCFIRTRTGLWHGNTHRFIGLGLLYFFFSSQALKSFCDGEARIAFVMTLLISDYYLSLVDSLIGSMGGKEKKKGGGE